MLLDIEKGRPNWLSAYPNEGVLDYFGGRFYRQPHRAHLVRGAAANEFKTAKTLIFYSALCYGFRVAYNLDYEAELTEESFALWQRWFKNANFLYIVNCYAQNRRTPDAGFTGAADAYLNYFEDLQLGKVGQLRFEDSYPAIYPDQRQWGYLAQFWRAPLHYFRAVVSIENCLAGEYGKECHDLISRYPGWMSFIGILELGVITKSELPIIQDILECEQLSEEEKLLARRLIFDKRKVTGEENDFYKTSFSIVNDLLENGIEEHRVEKPIEIASAFTYRHLRNAAASYNQEYWWRIILVSLAFDCGIHRIYSLLGELAENDVLRTDNVKEIVKNHVTHWLSSNGITDNTLSTVCDAWKDKYLNSFRDFDDLYARLSDQSDPSTFIDGLIMGYLDSITQLPEPINNTESYLALTDDYHHFIPRAFFRKKINRNADFKEFIEKTVFRLINEQYEFSIVRMGFVQKAKFILIKDEATDNYIFQIDARRFHENRGIINMIDASLSLWRSAGLLDN